MGQSAGDRHDGVTDVSALSRFVVADGWGGAPIDETYDNRLFE